MLEDMERTALIFGIIKREITSPQERYFDIIDKLNEALERYAFEQFGKELDEATDEEIKVFCETFGDYEDEAETVNKAIEIFGLGWLDVIFERYPETFQYKGVDSAKFEDLNNTKNPF